MKKHLLAGLATTVALVGLLAPSTPAHAASEWQDGKHDEDTIVDCITGLPSTGVHANVSWRSPDGEVPEVGEKFYLRGYIGLVSLPCSGKVAVLPEILVPRGVEFVDEDVLWDLTEDGEDQDLHTGDLAFDHGANGGILIGNADFTPFTLRQGDVLEFQFPVRATRELKGPATQRPECQDRIDGTAPCPISQAGDHFQVGFTVGGHGGDKHYVTPYVGLFAAAGGQDGKVGSTTTASYVAKAGKPAKANVVVTADRTPLGKVVVLDKGKVIGSAVLEEDDRGRISIALGKLAKGTHKLVAKFLGSGTVEASASKVKTLRLG